MSRQLESGDQKIQKICDTLREEALEPARREAKGLVDAAEEEAALVIERAKREAEEIVASARRLLEEERRVFHASLEQGAKQCFEALKQRIEKSLFNGEFEKLVHKETADPKVIARMIEGMVHAVEKEGIDTDLAAVIPKAVSIKEVSSLLGKAVLDKLKEGGIEIGALAGGAQVVLRNKKMTLDLSDQALKELLAGQVRKDFREMILKD